MYDKSRLKKWLAKIIVCFILYFSRLALSLRQLNHWHELDNQI